MKSLVRITLMLLIVLLAVPLGYSQQPSAGPPNLKDSQETLTFPLWPDGAPGALGHDESDIPTLTYYPAAHGAPTAVIVAPGGGYRGLEMNYEGRQVANWFNAAGISAFVLKYRLGPRYHHPIELGDAQRAIRLVRAHAADYLVKPDRIGMIGFSAGGHLTSTAEAHFDSGDPQAADPIDRVSSRPDFAVLCYAVVSMTEPYSHRGSVQALLGDNPDTKLLDELSNERHITPQTPPTFLFSTSEDTTVPSENSVAFYLALHEAHVPAELHIFQKGKHGAGFALADPALGEWPTLLLHWLRGLGLLEK